MRHNIPSVVCVTCRRYGLVYEATSESRPEAATRAVYTGSLAGQSVAMAVQNVAMAILISSRHDRGVAGYRAYGPRPCPDLS